MPEKSDGVRAERFRLRQIADELGLSISTVSRALTGAGHVCEETRKKVLAAAQRLHNQSNLAVGADVTKRLVGLLMPWYGASLGMGSSIAHIAQDAVRTVCESAGLGLLYNCFGGPQRTAADDLLDSGSIAGALLYRTKNEERLAQMLAARKVPHIFTFRNLSGTGLNYVGIDFAEAMRLAVEHCVEAGYKRLALIVGDTTFPSHAAFSAAFQADTARLDLNVAPEWLRTSLISEEGGYEQAGAILGGKAPQAIICSSDRIALGALRAVHDSGSRVPDDIAVISLDGTPQAAFSRPALTSVVVPWHDMFSLATRMLLELIHSPKSVGQVAVLMRCELVVRESTVTRAAAARPARRAGKAGAR